MSGNKDPLDIVQQFIDKNSDSFGQIGFGGVMGYCSGMAFRRVGKFVGLVIGVGFMGMQTAKNMGYIDVDWNKIKDDAIKPLDMVSVTYYGVIIDVSSTRRAVTWHL